MGLQPEISTDAKGNVMFKTTPKAKETPEETKAKMMSVIAQDEAKGLPPDQQPVAVAKSFLRQSVDLVRAGHIPNSLEGAVAYGINESAAKAFPDDPQARSRFIVGASMAAKTQMEKNDPRLQIQQNDYDLRVKQYNRELNNDNVAVRDKAAARLDTEINRVTQQIDRNQKLLQKSTPGIGTFAGSLVGTAGAKQTYKTFADLQTQIAADQLQLTRLKAVQEAAQGNVTVGGPGAPQAPVGPGTPNPAAPQGTKVRLKDGRTGVIKPGYAIPEGAVVVP